MPWVWTKSVPAVTFPRSFPNDSSFEPRNGSAAAPRNTLGACSTLSPPRRIPVSRSARNVAIISSVLRSKTAFASFSFPAVGGSPHRQRTLWIPRAEAPVEPTPRADRTARARGGRGGGECGRSYLSLGRWNEKFSIPTRPGRTAGGGGSSEKIRAGGSPPRVWGAVRQRSFGG